MRRKIVNGLAIYGSVLMAVFVLSSCTFFTTSWGENANRGGVNVTTANAAALVEAANGNKELSARLLEDIKRKAAGASGADKIALQQAGVQAAIQAADLSSIFLDSASVLFGASDGLDPENIITSLASSSGGLKSVSNSMAELLSDGGNVDPDALAGCDLTSVLLISFLAEIDFSDPAADTDGDGVVSLKEALYAYGDKMDDIKTAVDTSGVDTTDATAVLEFVVGTSQYQDLEPSQQLVIAALYAAITDPTAGAIHDLVVGLGNTITGMFTN